jgi:formate dehydrogenase iron-sulfur subunit
MIRSNYTSLTVGGQSLIDDMLREQQSLTAVDRFSQRHDQGDAPSQQKYYRDLIPAAGPSEGQQYAFEVDLDACSGCKSCVAACHNLNGLDETETWRDVGQLIDTGYTAGPAIQHVTTACHHCLEPACLDGCPVMAYEKDPVTGIVKHLDDQCIGCQYCILKCPYDAPKFNADLGIVRKCDMCSDRLAVGEAPACVQSCPTNAISIKIVDTEDVREKTRDMQFLTGAPEPDYTLPTTNYKTTRDLSMARSADEHRVVPEHAHLPLVIMLVLTQLSVGGFLLGWLLEQLDPQAFTGTLRSVHAAVSLSLGMLALGASTLHLGRPMYAFRAVIGLRTSWLSREIVGFGMFAKLAAAYAGCLWFAPELGGGMVKTALGASVVMIGLAAVLCSVMIYHDTRRVFWRGPRTWVKFYLTALVLGAATTLLAGLGAALLDGTDVLKTFLTIWGRPLFVLLISATVAKLLFEASVFRHLRSRTYTPMRRSATLMVSELHQTTVARFMLGLVGGVIIPGLLLISGPGGLTTVAMFIAVVAVVVMITVGELLERYLFFTAVVAPRMPGGLGS